MTHTKRKTGKYSSTVVWHFYSSFPFSNLISFVIVTYLLLYLKTPKTSLFFNPINIYFDFFYHTLFYYYQILLFFRLTSKISFFFTNNSTTGTNNDGEEWGWGIIINFRKKLDSSKRSGSTKDKLENVPATSYNVDVLLPCKPRIGK